MVFQQVFNGHAAPGGSVEDVVNASLYFESKTFLHGLFVQGAFQGQTSRDAFLVKCDSDTTSADDIVNGRVNIVIGFAPLKPAEFVIIRLQQLIPPGPDDDGPGRNDGLPPPGGSGIAGMRERAAALGGELHAGPRPGGGFRVTATLPLDGSE